MTESMPGADGARFTTLSISKAGLGALARAPGIALGGLSPLVGVGAGSSPPDVAAMVAWLEALQGDWQWATQALMDPGTTLAMVLADPDTQVLSQYAWPDPGCSGPGFLIGIEAESVQLSGPVRMLDVDLALRDGLALGMVASPEPSRVALTTDQFWCILALVDAYSAAALGRRAARIPGAPLGLSANAIAAAWVEGCSNVRLNWAVSLFAVLAAGLVPADLSERLPSVLDTMGRAELLTVLEADADDPTGDLYLLGDQLQGLCDALAWGAVNFGLLLQSFEAPGQVEVLRIGGWRTPGGIVTLDASALGNGRAEVLVCGPGYFQTLLARLLRTEDPQLEDDEFRMAATCSPADLLAKLAPPPPSAPVAQPSAPAPSAPSPSCPSCGASVRTGAQFCSGCGQALRRTNVCAACGAEHRPGARFCPGRGQGLP